MLTKAQAIALKGISGRELESLCKSASDVRELHWGKTVTYSRKVFVPLTNMCRDTCSYCTFVKTPRLSSSLHYEPRSSDESGD